ncbi:MAG: hypothetical protein H6706_29440 [Myxococcales bacterium]|nr:hypothetical protein [Myxococcales bacterium]
MAKVGRAVGLAVGGGALLLTRTAPTEAPRPAVAPTTGAASAPATTLAPAPAPAVPQDEPLAAERALLAGVAAALRRGDGAEALRGVDGHRARFPRGRLVEEREALAVRALVLAGRHDEARAAAEAFAARFPDSLLGGGVRAAVDQIP